MIGKNTEDAASPCDNLHTHEKRMGNPEGLCGSGRQSLSDFVPRLGFFAETWSGWRKHPNLFIDDQLFLYCALFFPRLDQLPALNGLHLYQIGHFLFFPGGIIFFFRKQREIIFLSNVRTFCVVSFTDGVNLGTNC